MNQTIEIDDEVYDRLKAVAEPFVDTPNSVLRRLLQLDGVMASAGVKPEDANGSGSVADDIADNASSATKSTAKVAKKSSSRRSGSRKKRPDVKKSKAPKRAQSGSILPEEEYELPLLESLVDAGGSAPSREVVEAIGKKLGDRLTDVDREPLKSGAIRWENRIQFVRLKMIERGWMEKDVPRGTWAISDEGRKQVAGGNK